MIYNSHYLKFGVKRLLSCFIIAVGLLSLVAHADDNIVKMDRIVAIVDKDVITEHELMDKMQTVIAQLEKQGKTPPNTSTLKRQVLERLVVDNLQLQLARRRGIQVNDTQLDKTMQRIAEQNQLSLEAFKEVLQKDGIPYYKFREDMRSEITIARLKDVEMNRRVEVSEGEIDNFLTTQSNNNSDVEEEFSLSHILIRTPQEATPDDIDAARARVEDALTRLNNGEDFAQVSANVSDAPNALEGGNMGWRKSNQIPPAFLELLQSMEANEISKPIRSPNGFHIVKIDEKRTTDATLIVEQTHARHILIKLNEVVSEQDAKQKMDGLKERLDNGDNFEDLARQYSEDGSANNGGDLGWVNPGDTVPKFEAAMNALAPGEISEPVLTPFGWHIIQVIARRKEDMTDQAARIKARKEIKARKTEEAYEDWLHELRDQAFVELRLEDTF